MEEIKIDGINYKYRKSDAKRMEDKHFLGKDDAIEIAINKQIMRDYNKKNRGIK